MSIIDTTWISANCTCKRFTLERDFSFWEIFFLVLLAIHVIDPVAQALCNRYLSSNIESLLSLLVTKRSKYPTQAEWNAIVKEGPGMRMWKGKMTLFWNGEELWDEENDEYLVYTEEQREKWQVIIVLPGVEVIPDHTFKSCENVETVIMADTVRRIEETAFRWCYSLVHVRLSRNLEYIGNCAFIICSSLTSIFIPPSCREIGGWMTFWGCEKLIILSVPQHAQLGRNAIANTALIAASSFHTDELGRYENHDEVNEWIKDINQGDEFTLHRACSAFNPPLNDMIVAMMKRQGLPGFGAWRDGAWREPNAIGVTPLQYLEANPYAVVDEQEIVKKYILEMMGELAEST